MAPLSRHLVALVVSIVLFLSLVLVVPGVHLFLQRPGPPDFKRYHHLRTLSSNEFPTDDPHGRVIFVGDIHGMKEPFRRLLQKIAYDRRKDVLVHTGDILAKGRHSDSIWVVDFMASHNVTGVRGNHDQKVIEWRGWIDWFATLDGGQEWLSELHSQWNAASSGELTLKKWVKDQRERSRGQDARWWDLIPESWIPFGDHYRIAKDLTREQYDYLVSLPLKLHIPSAHAFVIHAGLLPQDVRYDYDHKRQPLAQLPRIPPSSRGGKGIEALRNLQELAVLHRIPQNTDPWVNLNMRSVLENNEISRKPKKGTYWTEYWNDQMSRCGGFVRELGFLQTQKDDQILPGISLQEKKLPCYPSTVIYGHTSSRGLDINRWTIGLDSRCAGGMELSALILGPGPTPHKKEWEGHDREVDIEGLSNLESNDEDVAQRVKFGEYGRGMIVQVSCGE